MIFYKLYLLIGLLETTLEFINFSPGVYATKPLLMPLLALAFWHENIKKKPFKVVLLAALFFSWIGDVALLHQSGDSSYFILGLCAFLAAHLLYISAMRKSLGLGNANRLRGVVTLVAVLGLTILLAFYFEREGNAAYEGLVRAAVPIYSVVLGVMVLAAAHQSGADERYAVLLFSGALLFMFSDLVIALRAFSNALAFLSKPTISGIIMTTYILAQFLIIRGMVVLHDRVG